MPQFEEYIVHLSNRVRLEPMCFAHFDQLDKLFNSKAVLENLANKNLDTEALIEASENHWGKYGFGMYAIIDKTNEYLIGRGGVRHDEINGYPVIEFLILINKIYWRHGDPNKPDYAKQLGDFVIKQTFENPYFNQIEAIVNEINEPAAGLIRKLDFQEQKNISRKGEHEYLHFVLRKPNHAP